MLRSAASGTICVHQALKARLLPYRDGRYRKAADWAEQAASSPGAHCLIALIAVAAHGLNANDAKAKEWAASARARMPDLTSAAFLRAFPFRDPGIRKTVTQTLARYGF